MRDIEVFKHNRVVRRLKEIKAYKNKVDVFGTEVEIIYVKNTREEFVHERVENIGCYV